jgi:O-methyltransferase
MGKLEGLIGSVLDRMGLQLSRKGSYVRWQRRAETAVELESIFRQFVFPDLPEYPRRAELMARLEGTQVSEAIYLLNALHRSLQLPGDICEFGVAQGATSTLMANEIAGTDKKLWLFDSFEGLPRPTDKDQLIDDIFNLGSIEKYQGQMAHKQNEVLARLKSIGFPLARVQLVPGFIENTVGKLGLPSGICFAYVDFDFYEPIRIALRFLHDHMQPGAHIVVDDYGHFSSGAQTAVDEFVTRQEGRYECSLPFPFAGNFAVLRKNRA